MGRITQRDVPLAECCYEDSHCDVPVYSIQVDAACCKKFFVYGIHFCEKVLVIEDASESFHLI